MSTALLRSPWPTPVWPATVPPARASAPPGELRDQHGRRKRKLRLSIIDRCNYRCSYCMPDEPDYLAASKRLRPDELVTMATHFVRDFGITHIRVTGGEPTLHPQLRALIHQLNALREHGLEELHLSSNASRLAPLASALAEAGLDGVNISLDSLDSARYGAMCGGGARLDDALAGIAAARAAGLPVKLNMVVQAGRNDDELEAMLAFAGQHGLELRFIEFMPLDGGHGWSKGDVFSLDAILARLGPVEALPTDGAPARRFRRPDGQVFGVIASVTTPFCGSCDRLRVTADGQLVTCLYSGQGIPLRPLLQAPDAFAAQVRAHVFSKPRGYIDGMRETPLRMYRLGG
ncbi:MAG: GTP 3',8-cyclase MoaA [Oceanococcaceae bacterium]